MAQMISTVRNGVDTQQLFGTLDAIASEPELGAFTFRAANRWINGAHNRSRMQGFYGAGREDDSRREAFVVDAGEPTVLLGTDSGPSAGEYLLHALAACLTTTIVYSAAARKIRLTEIESTVEADMDVRGSFGLDATVRNGFTAVRATFRLAGDASAETLRELVEHAQHRPRCAEALQVWTPCADSGHVETPSFTFRLERVRTLRERAEETAREALTHEIRHRDAGRTLLDQARDSVRLACEHNRNALASGGMTSAVNLRAIQSYVERTEQLRNSAAIELSRREDEVNAKRQSLALAARDRQAIDKLKQRQEAEHNAEWARRSQNTLDELALAVHRRGALAP